MYRVVIKSGCGKNWDVHVDESQILADVPNCFAYHSTEKGCDTWEGITRIITFEEVA